MILRFLGKPESLIAYVKVKDRPGHDRRYGIDSAKITVELGWGSAHSFESGMEETVRWYLENGEWLKRIASGAYLSY